MSAQLSFVDSAQLRERQRALRTLLMNPLIAASGAHADEYGLVRTHARWLREWLARNAGWQLDLDGEVARLRKTPGDATDRTRGAVDKNGLSFTRRRYVFLCLALAVLERADRQTALGSVAEAVEGASRDEPGLETAGVSFDLASRDHRRDLVAVIRLLIELRVLSRVIGDEDQFVADRGDVLYNVNRPALTRMLNVQRGPSTVLAQGFDERITAILEEPGPDHEDVRNRRIRHRLVRRLLDDTVVFYDDLTPDERAYFVSQRPHIVAEIQEATGLLAEARAEGVAMVDERNELSDVAMPEDGTEGHVTLLVAEFLAAQIRTAPRTPVPLAAIHARVAEAADTHRSHWRSDAQEPGAEVGLCRLALDRLVALRLARVGPDGIVPLPPVGRYAIPREVPATPAASELAGTPARRRERSRRQRPTG